MDVRGELVRRLPRHLLLSPLKRAESLAEVELNVVSLALHADSDEHTALGVQVQPEFPW